VLVAVPRVLDLLQAHLQARFPDLKGRLAASERIRVWQRWWRFRDVHRTFGLKFWAFICGGASLPTAGEQFWNTLGFALLQGYGMTETTALVSVNHPFRLARGTVGEILPGREVRLSDEGEVLVRGETISNARWQDQHIQQQESEWLATGDLAEFDGAGHLRFRGRKKDVIVTSAGLNIYPEDLEAALDRQPAVNGSAVIEMSSDGGPEPMAVLLLKSGADAESAVNRANAELADFQRIHRWVVWPDPDFPRTSTGKILKREIWRKIASGEVHGLGDRAKDLNLDSLGRVQLQAQLEQQYGVSLDDAALQEVNTQDDVRQLIRRRQSWDAVKPQQGVRHIYPRWVWNPLVQAVRGAFVELIAIPLVHLLASPSLTNANEHWPASPMLIVSNHLTSYDAPFILAALPGRIRRRVAIAMSGEMLFDMRRGRNQGSWYANLFGPVAYGLITVLFNVYPLPQITGFRRSFQHAGEAVDRGYSVLVFPEGRRSDDESPQPFKSGAGLLWKELGTPALPVRLRGLGAIKAEHARWFRSGRVSVSVGQVLPLDTGKSPEQLTETLRQAVFATAPSLGETVERARAQSL
jgi:long-chain acyl-CoA synthetase